MTLILTNEEIEEILPVSACLQVLEEAYRDLGSGAAATVPRYDVFTPEGVNSYYEYKTMSGVFPRRKIAALRLNSSVVKWYEKAGKVRKDKLPVAPGNRFVGLVMLFSTETGEPLAIFPDGYVQKMRVAGAGAIGDLPVEAVSHNINVTAPVAGVTTEYGGYLVTLVECRFCHGQELAGGVYPDPSVTLITPNLTPGGELGFWTEEQFLATIQTGVTPSGHELNPELMPIKEVGNLTDDELKAIWLYLQSLPKLPQYTE